MQVQFCAMSTASRGNLTKPQLVKLCEQHGLAVGGNRDDLAARIEDFDRKAAERRDAAAAKSKPKTKTTRKETMSEAGMFYLNHRSEIVLNSFEHILDRSRSFAMVSRVISLPLMVPVAQYCD